MTRRVAADPGAAAAGHVSFRTARKFRAWLPRHHASEAALLVRVYKVHALETAGRMCGPGQAAFARREERKSRVYAYEVAERQLHEDLERRFRANARAWKELQARPPWYRRTSVHWVLSARREDTRARRLAILIDRSARGVPIDVLRRPKAARS